MRLKRLLVLVVLPFLGLVGQEKKGEIEKLAPYYPTPETIVEKMLQLGGLKAGEKMFDLGSGDGRIVIMAAQRFRADGTGVEFDDDLWKQSSEKIKSPGTSEDRPHHSRRHPQAGLQLGGSGDGLPAARFQRQDPAPSRKAA